ATPAPFAGRAAVRVACAMLLPLALVACAPQTHAPAPPWPTAAQVVNQFQDDGGTFHGYRRNHAKGICIAGYFQSNGKAVRYSVAEVFASGQRTPVIGRLSIPGTNPYAWDSSTPIRGMALELTEPDGQQWRTAMNGV